MDRKDFLKMSSTEYDNYMCSTYPVLFKDRNLPMSETCMCWGFDMGKGWYYTLDQLCRRLDQICKVTGIKVIFDQIKQKYGSGRFYYHLDTSSLIIKEEDVDGWDKTIADIVAKAEDEVGKTCEDCGEMYYHENINVGHWIYTLCEDCFVNTNHVSKEMTEGERCKVISHNKSAIERNKELKKAAGLVSDIMWQFNDETRKEVLEFAKSKIKKA